MPQDIARIFEVVGVVFGLLMACCLCGACAGLIAVRRRRYLEDRIDGLGRWQQMKNVAQPDER